MIFDAGCRWSVGRGPCSRISAAFNPTQWPHFAARLGAEATLFERLAAVVSGDGLVLIGMAVLLWWTALDPRGQCVATGGSRPALGASRHAWSRRRSGTRRLLPKQPHGRCDVVGRVPLPVCAGFGCSVDGMASCRFNEPLRTCIAGHPSGVLTNGGGRPWPASSTWTWVAGRLHSPRVGPRRFPRRPWPHRKGWPFGWSSAWC